MRYLIPLIVGLVLISSAFLTYLYLLPPAAQKFVVYSTVLLEEGSNDSKNLDGERISWASRQNEQEQMSSMLRRFDLYYRWIQMDILKNGGEFKEGMLMDVTSSVSGLIELRAEGEEPTDLVEGMQNYLTNIETQIGAIEAKKDSSVPRIEVLDTSVGAVRATATSQNSLALVFIILLAITLGISYPMWKLSIKRS